MLVPFLLDCGWCLAADPSEKEFTIGRDGGIEALCVGGLNCDPGGTVLQTSHHHREERGSAAADTTCGELPRKAAPRCVANHERPPKYATCSPPVSFTEIGVVRNDSHNHLQG